MIHAVHQQRPWIVIVEPDVDAKLLPTEQNDYRQRGVDHSQRFEDRSDGCGQFSHNLADV